jgi:hypothetical protein
MAGGRHNRAPPASVDASTHHNVGVAESLGIVEQMIDPAFTEPPIEGGSGCCVGLELAPTAMTASAPAVVMTAAATSHVTVAMSMASARENHRTVGARDQRLSRNAGHGRSG